MMRIITTALLVITLFFSALPTLAHAQQPSVEQTLTDTCETARRYKVYWLGLHIGDLFIEIARQANGFYQVTALIRSYGLAQLVSNYSSDTISLAEYKISDEGTFQPVGFQTSFQFRKKHRDITITYAPDGAVAGENNQPPENRLKRPAVPPELQKGAYDPLTLGLIARQKVAHLYDPKKTPQTFTLPMYDGRRRSDLTFTIHGLIEEGYIHVSFDRTPIAGFTNNELKAIKKRDPTIHMYLSQEDYWPVVAKGESPLGTAYGKLNKICVNIEACM